MKQKCQVVMLPTEKASELGFNPNNNTLFNVDLDKGFYGKTIFQHLYIISDEEIKESNWYYDKLTNTISHNIDNHLIATTNLELGNGTIEDIGLVSQLFVKEYIKLYNEGNTIKDVIVEYEVNPEIKSKENAQYYKKSKLNLDNTIIISKIEEKMYSRKEIYNEHIKFLKFSALDHNHKYNTFEDMYKEWFNKNYPK